MAITNLDIKFRQSQRMTDFADGGGRMSAVEIVDGDMNNVFGDRSDLDAILGRVSLRKMFLHVDTENTDTYLGAFVFLTDPPADPLVDCTLFNTGSATDVRAAAQNYVEAYRVKGPKTQHILYGTQLPGQMTIQTFCRPETPSPDIGDVLCLSVEMAGYTPVEQFVRVQEVASRVTTTFEDQSGPFQRDVLIVQLTTALAHEFVGVDDPARTNTGNKPPTVLRGTSVANAARYYSVKPMTADAALGDMIVNVGHPFVSIVPAAQAETPLVDQLAGLGSLAMIPSGAAEALTFSGAMSAAAGATATRYFGTPYARKSLRITVGAVELRDNGAGAIVPTDPLNTGWVGEADYSTGAFSLGRESVNLSGTVTAAATPAGAITEQAYSAPIVITPTNRQQTYVWQIPGQPAPGTVAVDFRALGKWIRLSDNGAGQLIGQAGEGSGTINYASGSVAVTLGALPDVDSAVILLWGTDLRGRDSSGEITIPAITYRQQLDHAGIDSATLTMAWTSGGTPRTATCDAAGAITGGATGTLDPVAGVATFTTANPPDPATLITYAYDQIDPNAMHSEVFTPTAAGGSVAITLTHTPIKAGSVRAEWTIAWNRPPTVTHAVDTRDNGSGGWAGSNIGPLAGSINYSTGAIALQVQ